VATHTLRGTGSFSDSKSVRCILKTCGPMALGALPIFSSPAAANSKAIDSRCDHNLKNSSDCYKIGGRGCWVQFEVKTGRFKFTQIRGLR